ncbi:hypothetical protein BcabD6B2_59040 (apicoplast) [Babesia caballi]|uniref:DNA-directed RNA polymerase n=1 Tax=Babesia caballi TaxID=5871 RepID=A0AAV4M303_BABCB|nr:hypothetical protein BcabD6B2_59040 [Babesia caballi]
MFNIKEYSPIYKIYINNILNNLFTLFTNIIKYNNKRIKRKNKINKNNIKIYFNLISIKSVEHINYNSYYILKNLTSYYSINIPIKFHLYNGSKTFNINYNILNIPKINQTGDIFINGHTRTPILYLKTIIKHIKFIFNKNEYKKYLIYLDKFYYLYIYIKDNKYIYIVNSENHSIDLNIYFIKNVIYDIKFNFSIYKFINLLNIINSNKYNDNFYLSLTLNTQEYIVSTLYIDIVHILNKFTNIKYNKTTFICSDDISNKSVNNVCDNMFDLIKKSLSLKVFIDYLHSISKISDNNNSLDIKLFRENFLINPSIHYTDQLNLLSYVHNKFKINLFGYSTFSDSTFAVPKELRIMQYNYLNFMNIMYTVDGEKCGILSTITTNTIEDKNKKLNTVLINKKKFNNNIYLDFYSKNLYSVTANKQNIIKKSINFKLSNIEVIENGEFKIIKLKKLNTELDINFNNIFNITELVIPFLLNNDICRSLMGSKMHTQAMPLIYPDNQYVYTKYNKITNLFINKYIISKNSGIVVYVTNYKITILDEKNRYINYYLCPYNINDYNSYSSYKPSVWKGEKISVGTVIAVPCDLKNYEFTLGFNNNVNYSFYYGYEHEDSIILNKNIVCKNILASLSFSVDDLDLSYTNSKNIDLLCSKTNDNIYYLYKIVYSTYKKLKKQQKSIGRRVLFKNRTIKVKRKLWFKHINVYSSTSLERLIKYECLFYGLYDKLSKTSLYLNLKLFLISINNIYIGDKLCGRHGNKGTVSKIVENINMPYTSNDCSPFIITSPVGAVSRMNVGQFLEGSCGNISKENNIRIKTPINVFGSYLYSNLYIKSLYNNFNNKYINRKKIFYKNVFRDFKTGYKLKNLTYNVLLYFFKLIHTSKSKFRYKGLNRSNILQQFDNNSTSQKFGEMEIWSLESHGVSYNTKELSLVKTDYNFLSKFYNKNNIICSKSFKNLLIELKSILINIKFNKYYNVLNDYYKYSVL